MFSTPGRLKNFRYTAQEVTAQTALLRLLDDIQALREFVIRHSPAEAWLSKAEAMLPAGHEWNERLNAVRREMLDRVRQSSAGDLPAASRDLAHALQRLKQDYITLYAALHSKARLGVNDDRRKVSLLNDGRLRTLQKLAVIDLMPKQHLSDFQDRLTKLQSCFALTDRDLERSPVCPHCKFQPSGETVIASGSYLLDQMENELDVMLERWTRTILENLDDPSAHANLELLKREDRDRLTAMITSRRLSQSLENDFVHALQEALSGLQKVPVRTTALIRVLQNGGGPATPEEMKKRFNDYLDSLTRGKDPTKVRIVLE